MYGLFPDPLELAQWTTYPFVAWNAVFLLGACLGVGFAWRRRQWTLLWGVLLVCGYYTLGTLAVKSAGMDTRERSMLSPLMAAAWVYGSWALVEVWRARRARTGPAG
jgi:hypothetical protein